MLFLFQVALLGLVNLAFAHPGEEEHHHDRAVDLSVREFKATAKRGLSACSEKLQRRDFHTRAAERRAAKVDAYRRHNDLVTRDTNATADTSHLSSTNYTSATPESTIFASNGTCILNPEGETGPYWVKGELIRSDVREDQSGVPITIEGQFVDVETCEPIVGLYWDIWNCNSTGVYSGLVATGNGNSDDESNLNATFLRGIQQTDDEGVVTFDTIFPGHYSGRTTHIHMVAHLNATLLLNNTLSGGTVPHVGQVFWDRDLINDVEATYPYNTNTIAITENVDDRVFAAESENTTSDPVLDYVYLGSNLSDGLFAWITIAVNTSATYDPNYSYVWTANGSIAESGGEVTVD
ncbi:Intradiol ring-cleavage dioxygenase [Lentinula detonsa]|uniref:Intradiol ring-cleavage dioxygenase n=1 Tax=Lentinula detonsa TaxID=2804962 RepID=A0A9W8P6N0_9AGAR|nr:Intradiol ring-cleavage dioxygenase [Lentinula detonsa]